MSENLHVAIAGPGATGSLLAATLVRSGRKVSLLCRNKAQARDLRRRGITVHGNTEARIPGSRFEGISERAEALRPCDIVFFCVKSHDTRSALKAARPLLAGAVVVSLQNGVAHLKPIRALARSSAVFGAACFAASRPAPGQVLHAGGRRILLGREGAAREAVARVQRVLRQAGWQVELGASVERLLWTKTALNAPIGMLAALSGALNADLAANPPLRDLLERAAEEGERTLRASGLAPLGSPLSAAAARLCRETGGSADPMLADLRAGRRTEADAVVAPLIDAARRTKTGIPVLSALARLTRGLEDGVRKVAG
jgi:2-dehydropantoate 2-reductase